MLGQVRNVLLSRSLAHNTIWMFLGQGARVLIQAVYFIVIARALGVEEYGAFVAVAALSFIIAPFSSLGAGNTLIKYVSTNKNSFGYYWGIALLMTFLSGTMLVAAVTAISPYILPRSIPLPLVLAVVAAEVVFVRLLDVGAQAYQAFERLSRTAQLQVLLSVSRLTAALALAGLSASPEPLTWGVFYLLSTALAALIAIVLVHRELGKPRLVLGSVTVDIREGFYFALGHSSQSIYNDVDKTMLARLSTFEATGLYAAAYRFIDVSFTPVRSLLYAGYARFFQHGASGVQGSLAFAGRLLPFAWVYATLAGAALYLTAPLLPLLLGADYEGAVEAVRWLCPLPFLKTTHYFAADTLTGAGFQGIRSGIQVLVCFFNVSVNLLLIPTYSWRGAAWASLASDGVLALGLWAVVICYYVRRKGQMIL